MRKRFIDLPCCLFKALVLIVLLLSLSGCSREDSIAPISNGPPLERFAIGSALQNPNTVNCDYEELIEATVGRVSRKAFEKYKNNIEGYVVARRSDARGKVFEATTAYEANQLYKRINDGDRVLTTAAEGDPSHPADNLLWRSGYIVGRYQLKSTQNTDSIIKFLSDPKYVEKYANEIIITHPNTFHGVLMRLKKAKQRGRLSGRWKYVEDAIEQGRLSNYIFPGHEVPSFDEAQKQADRVIRRQFEAARIEFGS